MRDEIQVPEGYNPRDYPPVAVTVDVVTFTIVDDLLQILLIKRGQRPYIGDWALPGGFVRPEENLEEAAQRELHEEAAVNAEPRYLEQLGTYGTPDRDPRMRIVTVAYWAILADLPPPKGGGDAVDAQLFPVVKVEHDALPLAFDHIKIIKDSVERIRSKLEYTTLAAKFCPPQYTISHLRQVYEAVWNARVDPPNFHRKVTSTPDYLLPTGHQTDPNARGGRPAMMYSTGTAQYLSPPIPRTPDRTKPKYRPPPPPTENE